MADIRITNKTTFLDILLDTTNNMSVDDTILSSMYVTLFTDINKPSISNYYDGAFGINYIDNITDANILDMQNSIVNGLNYLVESEIIESINVNITPNQNRLEIIINMIKADRSELNVSFGISNKGLSDD